MKSILMPHSCQIAGWCLLVLSSLIEIAKKNTVRVERAILDITQQQLADAIGVSRNTINSIESGKYVPSTVLALKIARYFSKPAVFICERGLFFVDL